jgi:YidC/Oxa1 family membrane protein insertase
VAVLIHRPTLKEFSVSDQKNAILAVVLSGLILFGWQAYFAPKNLPTSPSSTTEIIPSQEVSKSLPSNDLKQEVLPTEQLSLISLNKDNYTLSFSNQLDIQSIGNLQAHLSFNEFNDVKQSLGFVFDIDGTGFKKLSFTTLENSNGFWKGFNTQSEITASIVIAPGTEPSVKFISPRPFKFKAIFISNPKILENRQERKFAIYSDTLDQTTVGSEDQGDSLISWAGIDFNYHLFALSFDKSLNLLHRSDEKSNFEITSNSSFSEIAFNLFYVKKEYNYLSSLGRNLKFSVDFGMWGFFAVWILKGLQFFYNFFPNYGVSIILITLLVRLLTFPLQYKSFVGMKKLQEIQPEMTSIREKFKEDPVRLQKETMALFKKTGANPLGGCLPLLLQMPIFMAFYQVLSHAVELVGAPFYGWIFDLSNKDPYYIIPLFVAGSMFLQQKLQPSTVADPMQKKVLMFMPLIFGFMMKDLPSGLSLYFFFSTSIGIVQQMLVFKTKKA